MAEKYVKVTFDTNSIKLSSNTPDISLLISKIIEYEEKIDLKKIKVESNDKDFDEEGFELVVKKAISCFLEDIKINDKKVKEAIDEVKKREKDKISVTE